MIKKLRLYLEVKWNLNDTCLLCNLFIIYCKIQMWINSITSSKSVKSWRWMGYHFVCSQWKHSILIWTFCTFPKKLGILSKSVLLHLHINKTWAWVEEYSLTTITIDILSFFQSQCTDLLWFLGARSPVDSDGQMLLQTIADKPTLLYLWSFLMT